MYVRAYCACVCACACVRACVRWGGGGERPRSLSGERTGGGREMGRVGATPWQRVMAAATAKGLGRVGGGRLPVEGHDGVGHKLLGPLGEDELPQLDLAAAAAERARVERVEGDGGGAGVARRGGGEDGVSAPVPQDDVVVGDVAEDDRARLVPAHVDEDDSELSFAREGGDDSVHLVVVNKHGWVVEHPSPLSVNYYFLWNACGECTDTTACAPNERCHSAAAITVVPSFCEIRDPAK